MRCHCCDREYPAIFDKNTNRFYCSACWWIVIDAVTEEGEDIYEDFYTLDLSELQS